MTHLVSVNCASKRYAGSKNWSLSDVGLNVDAGEVVAVIGRNGAGKTTLFDIVGGLMKPTTGSVARQVDSQAIGWCPQREIVDWSLTVRQNIMVGLDLRTGRFNSSESIAALVETLKLSEYLDRTAETLSGGELRRTQIARALVGDPRFVILDEPTTGLDPDGITAVFGYIQERARQGLGALISTHETSRFARYCTRAVAMDKGRIIVDLPVSEFVALGDGGDDLWSAYEAVVASQSDDAS